MAMMPYPVADSVRSSSMADAFGAEVSVPVDGTSLFFIVGRGGPPDMVVSSFGGTVVTRLPDRRRVLAVLPLDVHAALARHPGVATAGPVSLDAERFTRFARLLGLDEAHPR
jgi:hypothetical protein